jgi:cell division protein ZapA
VALVNILVNGRGYPVVCGDGEEAHIRELGQFIDKRVRELAGSVGQAGDAHLLLMAGLVITDELSDSLAKLEERDSEIAQLKSALAEAAAENRQKSEDIAADALMGAASRLEAIAARLAHA